MNSPKFRFLLAATFLVLVLTGLLYSTRTDNYLASTLSDDPDALLGLRIDPIYAEVQPGDSYEFTAYGEYATTTVTVKAEWYLEDDSLGELSCEGKSAQKCTFTAGDTLGETSLKIEKESYSDSARLVVIEPLENTFTDELPDWASQSILRLSQLGIIQGYETGEFGSADTLTRSQIITLLHRLLAHLGLEDSSVTDGKDCDVFSDVDSLHFAYQPVCYFHYAGWLDSEGDDVLGVEEPASRGLTAFYVYRAFGENLEEVLGLTEEDYAHISFGDVPNDHNYFDAIVAVNTYGVMTGYPDLTFAPDNTLNRAESAAVLYRVLSFMSSMTSASSF